MSWKLLVHAVLLACFVSSAVAQQYHAVLIDGAQGGNGDPLDTWNDLFLMRRALIASGYDSTKISVLYFDGRDPDVSNPRYHQTPQITTGDAFPATIQAKFADLATTMTSNDVLFIWTHGHGQYTLDGHAYLDAYDGGGSIRDDTFASWVNPIPCRKKIIFMAQCHSGGFIDDLHDANPDHPALILTACHPDQLSQPADNQKRDNEDESLENEVDSYGGPWYHNEFNYHVLNAINYRTILGGELNGLGGYVLPRAPLSILAIKDFELARDSYIGKPPEELGYSPQYDDSCGIGGSTYLDVKMDLATFGKSASSQATGQNNQRKLYRETSGKLHEVFASGTVTGGEIFYRNSTDNGVTWLNTIRLSDGTMTSLAPCITMGTGTNVIVAWQQANGSNVNVVFRRSTNGGISWASNTALQSNFTCASPGPLPSVSANAQTGRVVVVYRSSSGLRFVASSDNMVSWSGPTGVPGSTSGNHNSPSTAYYPTDVNNCSLAFATDLGYSSVIDYCSYTGSWSGLTNLSSALPSYYQQQRNPSVAATFSPAPPICHVAWEALNMQQGAAPVLVHRKGTSGNFGSQYSVIDYQMATNPSISGLDMDNAWMVFQRSQAGTSARVRYSYSGGQWTWGTPVNGPAGNYAQISVGSNSAKYLYTSGTAFPWTVSLGSETLSKEDLPAVTYARELNLIDTKTGSSLTVKIAQPQLLHKDGTTSSIGFTSAPADSALIGTKEILVYGSTQPFVFPASTDTIKLQYGLRTVNAGDVLEAANAKLSFILVDAKSGKTLSTCATRSISNSSDTANSLYIVTVSAGTTPNVIAGAEITISPTLTGVREDDASLIASLGHIYRFAGEGAKEVSKEVAAEELGPKIYLLEQNYPNPFNPSTTLRFGLPEPAYVSLAIYNTLGQKVAEVAEGNMTAGHHEVKWEARELASGIYFARLTVTGGLGQILANQTTKLVFMK